MTIIGTYISAYDRRVRIVADALMENSELAQPVAAELAVYVLRALDHIPEKVR